MSKVGSVGRDYGSILLGSAAERGLKQRVRIQLLLTSTLLFANTIGALVAIALVTVGIPDPSILRMDMWWVNFLVVPIYLFIALVVGATVGTWVVVRELKWSIRDQVPTEADVKRTARAQRRLTGLQATLWVVAAVVFGVSYGSVDSDVIAKIVLIVFMSGVVVVAISSLFAEFILRPVNAEIMQAGLGLRRSASVGSRVVSAWLVGSGIPLSGIFLVVLFGLLRDDTDKLSMFISVTVLTAVALGTGLGLIVLFILSVTGPIRSVRDGMSQVQEGAVEDTPDLLVYDGSELGELQYGFNQMVAGLRERERMRDLFGRHVGRDVAEAALSGESELGGSEQVVAVVFVDIIGSTALAVNRTPTEVVDVLNQFFAVVVEVVEANEGLVNKFEGDAVLAIFGAPLDIPNPAAAALRAARHIAGRLAKEVPSISSGIGVSYGTVVAGNVGAIQRFEYTVIGDPVNAGARLSEVAKEAPRWPLASKQTIVAAGPREAVHWTPLRETVLRGRTEPTAIYVARP